MNQKEVSELRRRFKPEKSAISRIYGCYVNSSREIISYLDAPLGTMPEEEAEKYLGLLKKALSGTLGRNLIDIVFSTRQVADSEEHRLLTALRDSQLKDGALRQSFYEKLIGALELEESNYLILLAHDVYDVPHRAKDDTVDGSDTLPLTRDIFRFDTMILDHVPGDTLSLVGTKSGHGIRIDFAGFDFVGVWAAPGAPFVALEPWTGHTTLDTEDDVLEHKENITMLEPGAVDERSFDITLL